MDLKLAWGYLEKVNKHNFRKLPKTNKLKTKLDEGGFWITEESAIIAIDGSTGLDEWLNNFRFTPNDVGFHKEFYNSAMAFYTILPKIHTKVTILGYSRGAAIAQILGYLMGGDVEVITFGGPRICNRDGYKLLVNSKLNHTRVFIPSDPVTKVPFWVLGFKHYQTTKIKLKKPKGKFSHTHYKYAIYSL